MFLPYLIFAMRPAEADALVVDGYVLGCRQGEAWRRYQPTEMPSSFGFLEIGVGSRLFQTATVRIQPNELRTAYTVDWPIPEGVFYSGVAEIPREVQAVGAGRDRYLSIVSQFARNRGCLAPRPYLTQVWRGDFEGNGSDQEVIEAVSRPSVRFGFAEASDWSLVLLRWTAQGQERVYPLAYSFPKAGQPLEWCRLRAIADFDGDGRMEIVTSSRHGLGRAATLWSTQSGKVLPLAEYNLDVSP